jgi:hypothetical protein
MVNYGYRSLMGKYEVGIKKMEVSIVMGYPHLWMVYNRKFQSKMDDLGVPPF